MTTATLVGFTAEDPRRGTKFIVTHVAPNGGAFQVEVWSRPGVKAETVGHMHESWTERFEILSGIAQYRVGSEVFSASAGQTFELPPGVPHVHPWNAGDDELHFRQTSNLAQPNYQAIEDTFRGFGTMFRLSREGKVDKKGLPNPLQTAVILNQFMKHGNYIEPMPRAVQKVLFGLLSVIGRTAGYRIDPIATDDINAEL